MIRCFMNRNQCIMQSFVEIELYTENSCHFEIEVL
jgi:hypothetical protein